MSLHEKHKDWLVARGIEPGLIDIFGIDTRQREGSNWIVLPYVEDGRVMNHKWRLTQRKDHRMDTGQPLLLFNVDDLNGAERVVITEGEWDLLAVKTASLEIPCVSVPNGADDEENENPWDARRYEWYHRHEEKLNAVRSFVLATDNDKAGRALRADLARLLGPERCKFITYPEGCKDLNEVLQAHGVVTLIEVLDAAKDYPVASLYEFDDIPEPPDLTAVSTGVPGLDPYFTMVPTTLTLITGWSGIGKTSLLMFALANLIKAGIPMVIASFETLPKPILERRLRAAIYQTSFSDRRVYEKGEADVMFKDRVRIIANMGVNDDTDLDIEQLIELGRIAVIRYNIRLFVIDPWNEIEHKFGPNENETLYVGRVIRMLKRFARDYGVAVWLVAHPTKPQLDTGSKPPSLYSIAGSANFVNKADYGVIVHRADISSSQTEVLIRKVRMGLPGKVGKVLLDYDEWTNSYVEAVA